MANSTTTSITTTTVTTKDMKSKQLYLSMPRIPPKVQLKTVNPHITCNLCKGYLIDATTIVECLHSFCHSCIMMHLRNKTNCPLVGCNQPINIAKPNIKPDATLQAIVFKLVPGLYEKELLRRRAFYKLRTKEALQATPEQRGDDTEHLIFGPNESISLMLEYSDTDRSYRVSDDENSNSSHEINSSDHCEDDFDIELKKPKYLQCPAIFTISNLKKFLLHKFSINPNKFCVEIMYKVKTIALPDYYTLMDVAYIYTWKREAPMKFFYCVRAAHSPVASFDQNAVIYDLPASRFKTNSRLACTSDSTDQDQSSSDADSEVRSDGLAKKCEPETNGAEPLRKRQTEPIVSTSIGEPISASSSTTIVKSETQTTSTNQTPVNGRECQKLDISGKIKKEPNTSPTTSSRSESGTCIKREDLSYTPQKQQIDRKSNGTSPNPNSFKSRNTSDTEPGSSPSRTNLDSKDSKEKVKTNSIAENSSAKSTDSSTSRVEQKPIERSKSRPLPNLEDKSRSSSPPLDEYDFDQHLEKEILFKTFLKSIHLTPRIPSAESSSVQLPKTQKSEPIMNLSKDNKSTSSNSTASIKLAAFSQSSGLIKKPEIKASKRKSREPVKNVAKAKCSSPSERFMESKLDIKSSTVSTTVTSSSSAAVATTSYTTAASERLKGPNTVNLTVPINHKLNQSNSQIANAMQRDKINSKLSQLASSHGKSNHASSSSSSSSPSPSPSTSTSISTSKTKSPVTFKTPSSLTSKDALPSSSETSIIINNVQRPNQADTPRPSMQFKPPNMVPQQTQPFYFTPSLNRVFSNETEIQEIRNDDASKVKVYGPSMSSIKPYDSSIPNLSARSTIDMLSLTPDIHSALLSCYPKQIPLNYAMSGLVLNQALQHFGPITQNVLDLIKNNKNKRQLDLLAGGSGQKSNSIPNLTPPQNVHPLLTKCKIPASLSITVTNDETESCSIFNNKANVVNSIEIVKLTDESSGDINQRFPSSIATSNPSNLLQAIEKQTARSASPSTAYLGNNHSVPSSSQISTVHPNESFQAKFIKSLMPNDSTDKTERIVKKSKPIKINRPPQQQPQQIQAASNAIEELTKEALKRKQQTLIDDKLVPNKVRKVQRPIMPSKSTPTTQRPLPDLVMAKDEKRTYTSNLNSSTSSSTSSSSGINYPSSTAPGRKIAPDRKSPSNVSSATSAMDKALELVVSQVKSKNESASSSYLPIQTSATPFWKNHSTPDQMASYKALVENLTQSKKNSGTFVD